MENKLKEKLLQEIMDRLDSYLIKYVKNPSMKGRIDLNHFIDWFFEEFPALSKTISKQDLLNKIIGRKNDAEERNE